MTNFKVLENQDLSRNEMINLIISDIQTSCNNNKDFLVEVASEINKLVVKLYQEESKEIRENQILAEETIIWLVNTKTKGNIRQGFKSLQKLTKSLPIFNHTDTLHDLRMSFIKKYGESIDGLK